MKKLFLYLAAFAALVSCVEENALTPEKTGDNLVTIKAVAAETKTTLADDGTSIVWENGDAISLIFNYADYKSPVICDTEIESPASNADFTGDISEIDLENAADQVNLIYPATAFNDSENKITFSIPAEQDGIVGSGENFSYAVMAKSDIAGEKPEAQFHNALSLFKITVPEGVKTLKLTSNTSISGTNIYEFDENGALKWKGTSNVGQTVFINDENGLDASRTYDVLVFPGEIKYLTLELTGTDGATYTKTMSNNGEVFITLEAGKYYNLKMANLFTWNIGTELTASPLGDELVISASTTAENKYDIIITDEDGVSAADWISAESLTKGFHKDEIVLYVEENLTSATRKAKVTISYGDDKSQIFTVTQNCVFMDFVYTEENPIEWEESFGIYATLEDAMANNNVKKEYPSNVFRITLSEDFTKGTYKITNIFKSGGYQNSSMMIINNKGGEYYADYSDGSLIVRKDNAEKSYFFTSDITLTYDPVGKTFTLSEPASFNVNYFNADYNKEGYIGDYSAKVKVPVDMELLQSFAKTYTYSYEGSADNLEVIVTVVDEYLLFPNMFPHKESYGSYSGTYRGDVSADGKTITLTDHSSAHGIYGSINQTVLSVEDDGSLVAGSIVFQGATITNFKATVKSAGDVEDNSTLTKFEGTYSESYTLHGYPTTSNMLNISVDGDKLLLTNMFNAYSMLGSYKAELSDDGSSLTIIEEISPIDMGSCMNQVLTVSEDNGKIVLTSTGLVNDPYSGDPVVVAYTAKQN